MSQTTITQIQGTEETTVVVKRPKPSVAEAKGMVRGLKLEGGNDENLVEQWSIDEFIGLGAAVPQKFRTDGKPVIRANKNGTLFFGFILNGEWISAYMSNALQGKDSKGNPDPKFNDVKVSKGDLLSKSKHAIQLRLNPDAKPEVDTNGNEIRDEKGNVVIKPCFYLIVRNGGGSSNAVLTADDFAD